MKVLVFLGLFCLSVSASEQRNVQFLLPEDLRHIQLNHSTLSEVEKGLGKAHLVEKDFYYWERDGLKYAIQLGFNEKKILKSLHFTFTGKEPPFKSLKNLDAKKLRPDGRFLKLKETDFELIVDPVTKTIRSVKLI